MTEREGQNIKEELADALQVLADKDTAFRTENAEYIGELVAVTDPEWPTTYAVAGAFISDKTDGFWAKLAKRVRGYDVPTAGGEDDPLADHKLMEKLMGGLILRSMRMQDAKTAAKLSSYKRRTHARNERMNQNRQRIKESNIDQRELRANLFNKTKMVLQAGGCITLVSPLSNSAMIRRTALVAIGAGTKSSEIGEEQFRQKVDYLLENQNDSKGLTSP